jgi:hypothetical protein
MTAEAGRALWGRCFCGPLCFCCGPHGRCGGRGGAGCWPLLASRDAGRALAARPCCLEAGRPAAGPLALALTAAADGAASRAVTASMAAAAEPGRYVSPILRASAHASASSSSRVGILRGGDGAAFC